MSTNPIGAALTRYDAAIIAGALQTTSESSDELTGIATAIERVEALLAAGGPEPEGPDAIERIADIAFVLHERDVEASLCDALDAAVRELANANAAKQANVDHVRQAAEMLRELSQRVTDMIALLQMSPPVPDDAAPNEAPQEQDESAYREQQTSEDAFDREMPREGLFPAELLENDEFARAVAELAASLPALAEPLEARFTENGSADLAAAEPIAAQPPEEAVVALPRERDICTPEDPTKTLAPSEVVADAPHEPDNSVDEGPTEALEPPDDVVILLAGPNGFAAAEPNGGSELDEAVVVASPEPESFAAAEPTGAAEPEHAATVALREPDSFAIPDPVGATEPDSEVREAQSAEAAVVASEPDLAPELEETLSGTRHDNAHLAADAAVDAFQSEEPVSEPLPGRADPMADEPAPAQQRLVMDVVPAIAQTQANALPSVETPDEPLARPDGVSLSHEPLEALQDDVISATPPASEDIASETPSAEASPNAVHTLEQPAASPDTGPDHAAVNGHAVAALADTDALHLNEVPAPPAFEQTPHDEFAPTDNSPMTMPSAETEMPSSCDAPSPPESADATVISTDEACRADLPRSDVESLPPQAPSEFPSHDADHTAAVAADEVSDAPPRFPESSQALLPELALVDPQDDPGDLFEPMTDVPASVALANFAESQSAGQTLARLPARQTRSAGPADPLAPMSTLSAEELLALFT